MAKSWGFAQRPTPELLDLSPRSYGKMPSKGRTNILDIRVDKTEFDILRDIKNGLRHENGEQKTLPTLLLYDEAGLRLFEKITYLEEYYLTNAEIQVLETYADEMAARVQQDSIIVELGSGNLRKVNILLKALERSGKDVEYYAVDLSLPELERTFAEIPTDGYRHVKCFGLYGTYDDALAWLQTPNVKSKAKHLLWLGSSLGNFKRHEVPPFLRGFRDALQPGDTIMVGIDSCKDSDRVYHAYNDRDNVTRDFTLNGLKHANHLMGYEAFAPADWDAVGRYVDEDGCHRACVAPLRDVVVDGVEIAKGERVRIEESHKYSREESMRLWADAGLVENTVWSTAEADYGLHLVSKPSFSLAYRAEEYAAKIVPSIAEWEQLWTAWDVVTRKMIPEEELLSKPIKLRNACIFYLGHIPTFLDIHMTRATGEALTEPAYFQQFFERGIDPDVENPELCHDHSPVPDSWPALDEILIHQTAVRKRVRNIYGNGTTSSNRKIGRALWLGFEHEAMHLETLLYMLIQSQNINAPPDTPMPDFEALARQSDALALENEWFTIPKANLKLGLDDADTDTGPERYFGWDSEKPSRLSQVKSFRVKARPITNGEYAEYMEKTGSSELPASWFDSLESDAKPIGIAKRDSVINGAAIGAPASIAGLVHGKYVRTVFGAVALQHALHWPVVASYNELVSCAQWMGGRIPTMEEVRSIYNYVEHTKEDFEEAQGRRIPAVNGHLINNGVSETPPSKASLNGASGTAAGPTPHDLFIDLEGTNTAFQHWHPVSVAEKGNKLCGQSDLGGAWEWTSTVLEKHEGFEPMSLYPGYTADFFDGKHNVVLGGSWATHPRIAGRKSFVNWYQRNYPYVWATARIVTDI